MNIDDIYAGKYLKAVNLPAMQPGQGITVQILKTELIEYDDGRKAIGLHLLEFPEKILGLNKTNVEQVRYGLGDNWQTEWAGKHIELRRELVTYQGKAMEAIRCYPVAQPTSTMGETSIAPQSAAQAFHGHTTGGNDVA